MVITFVRFLVPLSLDPALYASSGKDSTLEPSTCLQVESPATEDPPHRRSVDHLLTVIGIFTIHWA
jgi:hypothetical protein